MDILRPLTPARNEGIKWCVLRDVGFVGFSHGSVRSKWVNSSFQSLQIFPSKADPRQDGKKRQTQLQSEREEKTSDLPTNPTAVSRPLLKIISWQPRFRVTKAPQPVLSADVACSLSRFRHGCCLEMIRRRAESVAST